MSNGWERIRLRVETVETFKAETMNQNTSNSRTISCHVLDTALGKAVADLPLTLYRQRDNGEWQELGHHATNADGRVGQLVDAKDFNSGTYKLKFDVQPYFELCQVSSFYPFIEIIIKCERGQHYHVPLLLSPFGYTTYRGT
ncbi:uncharacterized protein LOC133330278 [Musca vetustissima]|uniref:uncharacterized protein LOC133330278 n=1 Tax=Musca vetustissima TaxID=27455 RepID=UPI002AB6FDAD|nr:uncharacterized protein LOC133330278 [Musca vetustissima]